MLAKGTVFAYPCSDLSGASFQPLILPHPGTNQPQAFLYSRAAEQLLELQIIHRPETSSFIAGDQLVTHGNLTTGVVFDWHFLLAPLLPRDGFLSRADWTRATLAAYHVQDVQRSLALVLELPVVATAIINLCDVKVVGDCEFFRLSSEKFVDFVVRKFQRALSANFTPVVPFLEGDVATVLMEAVEAMIFDVEIAAAVRSKLGIVKKHPPVIADAPKKEEPPKKKPKIENKKNVTPAGCQKISTFFAKK